MIKHFVKIDTASIEYKNSITHNYASLKLVYFHKKFVCNLIGTLIILWWELSQVITRKLN